MKTLFLKNKKLFKNIGTIVLFLIISFYFSSLHSFAITTDNKGSGGGGATVENVDMGSIPTDGKGLVPECAHLGENGSVGKECTLQDLFGMIKPIRDILIYAVVIVIVGFLVYSGIFLVLYGDIPENRQKLKKQIKNGVIAIIILVAAPSLIFAALVSFGFNQDILKVLKQIFAFNDFSFIPHALAQSTTTNQYISLFPQQGIISLIQRTIKFFIYYIAAPILSFGVIWAGFRFVKAEGNPEELASAKKFATWVVIAIVVAIAAPLLVNILLSTIKEIISPSSSKTAELILEYIKIM